MVSPHSGIRPGTCRSPDLVDLRRALQPLLTIVPRLRIVRLPRRGIEERNSGRTCTYIWSRRLPPGSLNKGRNKPGHLEDFIPDASPYQSQEEHTRRTRCAPGAPFGSPGIEHRMMIHPVFMSQKIAANRQPVIGFTKVLCASLS